MLHLAAPIVELTKDGPVRLLTFWEMIASAWPGVLLVGAIVGSVIAWIVTRKTRKAMRDANDQTISAYHNTIKAKDEFINTLNQLHEQQIGKMEAAAAELAEAHKAQLDKLEALLIAMTTERDGYRTTLHDIRGELGGRLTEAQVEIAELKSRPNVDALFQAETEWNDRREKFYTAMSASQERLVESQNKILALVLTVDDKLESESQQHRNELREYSQVCSKTAEAMDALVHRLTADGVIRKS
jgi:predicted  nucleic acid-binding Zn-ribbon protein